MAWTAAIIAQYQRLAPKGELAVEHHPKKWMIHPVSGLEICREKVYGNTAVTFYWGSVVHSTVS